MPNAKKKGVFFAVLVLFAINILNFYDRHVPGALVEPMRREFHLSDMQIGLLGSVFIWRYAIMGVPFGGALAYFSSGPLAQAHGWRAAMVVAAAPALVLVPTLLMLEEPRRGASETHPVPAVGTSALGLLRLPTLWWIIASGVFLNFNKIGRAHV